MPKSGFRSCLRVASIFFTSPPYANARATLAFTPTGKATVDRAKPPSGL